MFWDTRIVEANGRFWWNTWCEARELEVTGWANTHGEAVCEVAVAIDKACAAAPLHIPTSPRAPCRPRSAKIGSSDLHAARKGHQ